MTTPKQAKRMMRKAMAGVERRTTLVICVKCGEETHVAFMSVDNPRMCAACWVDHDMDRFKAPEGRKASGNGETNQRDPATQDRE